MSGGPTHNQCHRESASKEVYYFSHVPKTAGTSFTVILDRFFHDDEIFKPQLWWEVGDVELVRKQDLTCFRGHFGMGATVLSQWPVNILTILRDPVYLSYSTYQYVKRESNAAVHKYVNDNDLSFEDFLRDPATMNLASNRLLKSLAIAYKLKEYVPGMAVNPENYKAFRKTWNWTRKTLPETKLLESVKNYLADSFWVGVLEDFEASLLMLCHKMAWPPIGPTAKLNSHNKPKDISEEAIELVAQLNPLDSELYAFAVASFQQQLQAFCAQLELDTFDAKAVNQLVDAHYQRQYLKAHNLQPTDGIDYNFSMVLLGQNWHRREQCIETDQHFRWTGPEKDSVIDFWLLPQRYLVRITYINVIDDQLFDHLGIMVNDHAVDWSVNKQGNGGMIEFITEKGMTKEQGLFRLTLKTLELPSHDSVFNSKDNRKVGIAIKQIEVVPNKA